MQEWLSDTSLPRREFMKIAVATGGATALSACLERLDGEPEIKKGPSDPSTLPKRQHAWDDYLEKDEHGNNVAPRHQVLLLFDYTGDNPTSDKAQIETVLTNLEKSYERGNNGLLFTIGYSPYFFERFDTEPDVNLQKPRALAEFEDPDLDKNDGVIQLASDHPQVVLSVEEALFGEKTDLNGISITQDLNNVFEIVDRRTGFVGEGLPSNNQEVEGIPDSKPVPEESPLFMGFKSGFKKNQASEDRATIEEGEFREGTTQHVSRITLELESWYDRDTRYQRVAKMFCPIHAEEEKVEGPGHNLGDTDGLDEECLENTIEHGNTYGVVGHSQKSARAREDDSPLIIRRDFNTTDGEKAGLHFVALQQKTEHFVETREAMNGKDVRNETPIREKLNNGILEYMNVERRGNYLIPPRNKRSLPLIN